MSELFDEGLVETEEPQTTATDRRALRRDRVRKQRQRRRRTAIAVGLSLVLVLGLGAAAVLVLRPLFDEREPSGPEDFAGPGTGEATVVVHEGASGGDIGDILTDAGVVASRQAFVDAFSSNPQAAQIQPGTYEVMQEMRAVDAVTALLDPANRSELRITVPEGWRASQIYERIASIAQIPVEEVEEAAEDTESLGLPPQAEGDPEGWLAAATYTFGPDADATEILSAMVNQTLATLSQLDVPEEDQQAVLTKASIVEREVFVAEDYGRVARVIENRLADTDQVNGRLQMDSTVLYGAGRIGGMPTRAELDEDTPYNSYLNPGLPPTPIGAPGRPAVEAVLDPPEGDWLYFVTVNLDTGETRFTGDYGEHQRNIAELNEWLEENPLSDGEE